MKELENGPYILSLISSLERMYRFCQYHNIIRTRLEMADLVTEIRKTAGKDEVTDDDVRKINDEFDRLRTAIRPKLFDDPDMYKSDDRAACLIEDGLWLLNRTSDRLAAVTRNMSGMKHAGFDDFNSVIALATVMIGREDMLRASLTDAGLRILRNHDQAETRRILEQNLPLVKRLDELGKTLYRYETPPAG